MLGSCEENSFDISEIEINPYEPPTRITNTLIRALSSENSAGLTLGCLTIQFPFELLLSNNSSALVNDETDFDAISSDSSLSILDFVFPINTSHPSGLTHTLNNWEEFTQALTTCIPDNGWTALRVPAFVINLDNSCYTLSYPVRLVDELDNSFSANSPSELVNLTASQELFFAFPLTLIDDDEMIIPVQDATTLYELLQNCLERSIVFINSVSTDGSAINCFDFIFPFSIVLNTGNTIEITDGEHFLSYLYGGWFSNFTYPLSLRLSGADSVLVAQNSEDFNTFTLSLCEETAVYPDLAILIAGSSNCFEAIFPIQAIGFNGSVFISISDFSTLAFLAQDGDAFNYRIEYPIQLILFENGQVVTVQNVEEMLDYFNACD